MPIRVSASKLRDFTREVFLRFGLPADDADAATDVLMYASLRGVDTHGVRNLKRYYIDGLTDGTINPTARYRVLTETPVTATVDGDGGLGLVTAYRAMDLAIEKAGASGVGIVTVRDSQHFGAAGYFAHRAVAYDMIGMCGNGYFFHRGQETAVLPFGGALPMLSTNPLAMACPSQSLPAFVLDMSTSVVPVNRIELMQELGRSLPPGWGLDGDGEETTDPAAVKKVLPLGGDGLLGGHKGFGLALAVQILTGVLSGAWKRDPNVGRVLGDKPEPTDGYGQEGVGHIFAAIRIDAFGSTDAFKEGMDAMIATLNAAPSAPGHERVVSPGQIEHETEQKRLRDGIPLNAPTVEDLTALAERFELPLDVD